MKIENSRNQIQSSVQSDTAPVGINENDPGFMSFPDCPTPPGVEYSDIVASEQIETQSTGQHVEALKSQLKILFNKLLSEENIEVLKSGLSALKKIKFSDDFQVKINFLSQNYNMAQLKN